SHPVSNDENRRAAPANLLLVLVLAVAPGTLSKYACHLFTGFGRSIDFAIPPTSLTIFHTSVLSLTE
ncbi:hypothetical protein, partial [Cupriavidus sp. DL-D2]|uniref:hypothetical protein n=1 Tax=Cupriavidus sp. DL-D2 TaxID=3144974 RepID=UPI003212D575